MRGFGSLDSESLDAAIQVLIDLQSSGRMIGIISHVAELKEQMALRIDVRSGSAGSFLSTVVHDDRSAKTSALGVHIRHPLFHEGLRMGED